MPIVSEHFRSLLDGSSQLHTASAMRIVATIILETRCYYYEVACSACRCGYRSVAPPTSSISNLSSDDIIVTAGCSGWTVRKGGRDAWDAAPTGCHGYGMMRLVPCCLRPLKFTYAARSPAVLRRRGFIYLPPHLASYSAIALHQERPQDFGYGGQCPLAA